MSREKDDYRRKLREEDEADREARRSRGESATRPVYLPVGIPEQSGKPYLAPDIRLSLSRASTVFAYLSLPSEPDVTPLVEFALSRGAVVLAPRVRDDDLTFAPVISASGPFDIGHFGIREPPAARRSVWPGRPFALPAVVLVPGLAFSPEGARLGRGKGYYDRFLSALLSDPAVSRESLTLVGVCRPNRVRHDVPTEAHDMPVDCLWTEKDGIFDVYY